MIMLCFLTGTTDVRCYKRDNNLLFYAEIPSHALSNPCMKDVQLFRICDIWEESREVNGQDGYYIICVQ